MDCSCELDCVDPKIKPKAKTKIKEWKINIDDADRDRLCIIEITSPLTNSERVKANNIIKIYPYARDFIDQSTLTLEELEKECNEGFVVKRGKTLSK